jgi:hypothetical protein
MTDFRRISRSALVDFTTNAATGVADGKVSGFSAPQNTAISDALTDANTVLAAADLAAVEAKAAAMAAMSVAQDAADVVTKQLAELTFSMRGVASVPNEYDSLGFDPPDTTRSVVVPQTPTELSATGYSNGINQLFWVGNNVSGSVTYAIEVKIGDTAPYVLLATATAQRYQHIGVTPGEFYQYRVRAQAARNVVSGWSNEAVVYGSQDQPSG